MTEREGFATTSDGTRLAFTLQQGESPLRLRPRTVLIHSLALDRSVWHSVAGRLADAADVLTYDCRGHGTSTRAAGPYSVELFADDLAALLDAVDWPTAIVGGASMGGSVALAFASRHPARVSGLALVDTTAWYGPDAARRWEERARQAEESGLASLAQFQLARWFSAPFREADPEVLQRCLATFVENDIACYAAACRMLGSFDLRPALEGVMVPTTVVVGELDYATPIEMARTLHRSISGSTLHVLAGARHLTPLERADDVARIMRGELIGTARVPEPSASARQ